VRANARTTWDGSRAAHPKTACWWLHGPPATTKPTAKVGFVVDLTGNDHRLVVPVAYLFGAVYVKFVGTHAEYDLINARTVESKP